jgi:hypothetical protein
MSDFRISGASDVTQSLGAVAAEGLALPFVDATDICAATTGTLEATGPPLTLRCFVLLRRDRWLCRSLIAYDYLSTASLFATTSTGVKQGRALRAFNSQ